jgi:exonuclease SbcD
VTDAARPHDLVARVRGRFPHALVVRHEPAGGALLERGHLTQVTSLDPVVVAESFVRYVSGADATDAELDVFVSAYEAVTATERSA